MPREVFWLNIVPTLQQAVHPDRIPARPRLGRALEMHPGLNFKMYMVLWEALTINGKDVASVKKVLVGWQSHSKFTQAFCDPCRLLNTNDDEIDLNALQRPAAIWRVGALNSTLPDGYRFWP